MTVDDILDGIIEREQGYVDNPDDRGGPTKYGITAKTLGLWRRLGRQATRAEVKGLQIPEARDIYRAEFVKPFDFVPFEELRVQLIDYGVNSSPRQALLSLQKVLGVEQDGIPGPRTRTALVVYPWKLTHASVCAERCKHCSDLAEKKPTQRQFLRGWIRRAVSFLALLVTVACGPVPPVPVPVNPVTSFDLVACVTADPAGTCTTPIPHPAISVELAPGQLLELVGNEAGYVLVTVPASLMTTRVIVRAEGYQPRVLEGFVPSRCTDGCHNVVFLERLRPALQRVRVEGRGFVTEDGQPWRWRGVSAFQLVDDVADGREADALAFLDWAKHSRVTIVRIFVMAYHMFQLSPWDGLRALPRTLELVEDAGLHAEVVALADTGMYPSMNWETYIAAIGQMCDASPACVLELSNEPEHSTQDSHIKDPTLLLTLARLVPARVVVALGAAHGPDDESRAYIGGDYVTVHSDRNDSEGNWRHVRHTKEQRDLSAEIGKPVVNDEPRRDDLDPTRNRALGWLTHLFGLGDTFHYGDGRYANPPTGDELRAFEARRQGWEDLPAHYPCTYQNTGFADSPVKSIANIVRAYSCVTATDGYTLVLGREPNARFEWGTGWPTRRLLVDLGSAQLWAVSR